MIEIKNYSDVCLISASVSDKSCSYLFSYEDKDYKIETNRVKNSACFIELLNGYIILKEELDFKEGLDFFDSLKNEGRNRISTCLK